MPIDRRGIRASEGKFRIAAFVVVAAAIAAAAPPLPAAVRLVPPAAYASSRQTTGESGEECKDGKEGCPSEIPARLDEWAAKGGPRRDASGRIEGTVTLGEKLKQKRMRFALYPQDAQQAVTEARRASPARGERDDEFRNVVVYLESAPALQAAARGGAAPQPPSGPFSIRQEGLAFVPHVLPILRGSTVEFPNTDPVFHNVFSLARAATFDLGRYPRGDARSVRFETAGIVKVFCHIHSDMSAVVMILDNPFFVVPDSEGRFTLDGLPPGEYKAVAWHERARLARRNVRIEAGRATMVSFDIPLSEDEAGD